MSTLRLPSAPLLTSGRAPPLPAEDSWPHVLVPGTASLARSALVPPLRLTLNGLVSSEPIICGRERFRSHQFVLTGRSSADFQNPARRIPPATEPAVRDTTQLPRRRSADAFSRITETIVPSQPARGSRIVVVDLRGEDLAARFAGGIAAAAEASMIVASSPDRLSRSASRAAPRIPRGPRPSSSRTGCKRSEPDSLLHRFHLLLVRLGDRTEKPFAVEPPQPLK